MKFTVIWKHSGVRKLTALYVRALESGLNTAAITAAVAAIDALLASSPQDKGESREEDERALIVDPLTVFYEVHEDEHVVFVLSVTHHDLR